jgi:carbon-monoxide dehydrogenase small subunit
LVQVEIAVNGERRQATVSPETTLLEVLRQTWHLTGTKQGCEEGDCGACTVLLDGRPVNACLVLAIRADGREVLTIEGLGNVDNLHTLQNAFVEHASLQCGFCGPGMLVSSKALLDSNPNPSEFEIRRALSGNLCRCTGYSKIVEAVQSAAQVLGRLSRSRKTELGNTP